MSKVDIIEAYEAGLITRGEAVEQGLVETIDRLYEKASRADDWTPGRRGSSRSGHLGR